MEAHSCPVGQQSKVEAWLRCRKQLLAHSEGSQPPNRPLSWPFCGIPLHLAPRSSFIVAKSVKSADLTNTFGDACV